MTRDDLDELEKALMKLVVSRRQLGGFDVNAEAILIVSESLLKITSHLREKAPRLKKVEE